MTIDQLFNKLPRDLQWEVLEQFVGTHVVRKGRLLRKLVFNTPHQTLKPALIHIDPKFPWRYGKYGIITVHPEIPAFLSDNVNILSYTLLPSGCKIMYCEGTIKKHMRYIIFRTANKHCIWDHEVFQLDDTVPSGPFIKHDYPSYPFTNKKLGRRS